MDLYDPLALLCARRRSVRSFSETPLTGDEIEKIRAVALTAPYASGKKNWELMVVTDREVIGELAGIVRRRSAGLAEKVRGDFGDGFLRYAENFSPSNRPPPSSSRPSGRSTRSRSSWRMEATVPRSPRGSATATSSPYPASPCSCSWRPRAWASGRAT